MKLDSFRHEFCIHREHNTVEGEFDSTLQMAAQRLVKYESRGYTIVGDRPPTSWKASLPPEGWGMDKKNDSERIIRYQERIVKTLGFRALWYGISSETEYMEFDERGFPQELSIFNGEGQRFQPQHV